MKASLIVLGVALVAWVFPVYAGDQVAQAPLAGQCEANFQACYNVCRIQHPDQGFRSDQNRVACGNSCFQVQNQCLGKSGAVSPAPNAFAPYQAPRTYAAPPQPVAPSQQVVRPSSTMGSSANRRSDPGMQSQNQTQVQPQLEERKSGIMAPVDNVISTIFSPLPVKRKKKFKR